MKLCRKQLNVSFGQSLLVLGMLLVGVFSINTSAKAVDVVGYETSASPNVTHSTDYSRYGESFIASTTNITKAVFKSGSWGANKNLTLVICEDPDTSSSYNPCFGKTIIYTENFTDIYISETAYTDFELQFSEMVLLDVGTTYGVVVGDTSGNSFDVAGYNSDVFSDGVPLGRVVGWFSDSYFRLYYDPAYTSSNDYILYYGPAVSYTDIANSYSLPVVYNICDSWSSSSTYVLGLYNASSTPLASDIIELSSCSGTINFNTSPLVLSSNTAHFTISEVFGSDLVSSNEFISAVWGTPDTTNNYILFYYPNPYYINTANEPPLNIEFAFDICDLSSWSNTSFYIRGNTDGVRYNDTAYIPTSCTEIGNIDLNYPLNGNLSLDSSICLYDEFNQLIRCSDSLLLVFHSVNSSVVNVASSTAVLVANLNCQDSSNWVIGSACYVAQSIFTLINVFSDYVLLPIANGLINLLKVVFPFNIVYHFYSSFNLSVDTSLPSDLAWLEIGDGNGNLSIVFPKELVFTESDLVLSFWGPDVFAPDGSKAEEVFYNLGILLGYLLQAGFLFTLLYFSEDILEILRTEYSKYKYDK